MYEEEVCYPYATWAHMALDPELTLNTSDPAFKFRRIGPHGAVAPGEGKVCSCVLSRARRRFRRRPDKTPAWKTLLVFDRISGSSLEEAGERVRLTEAPGKPTGQKRHL